MPRRLIVLPGLFLSLKMQEKEAAKMPLQLNYYYGNEAEQYTFYRIPKILFTDPLFKGGSVEAKVL